MPSREDIQRINASFYHQHDTERARVEAEDLALRQAAERERRGLPSAAEEERQRQIEEHNAQVRENQRRYFEQQQQPPAPQAAQPQQLTAEQETRIQLLVRDAALAFMANSDYHRTSRNMQVLTEYIDANGLDATKEASFHTAYAALRDKMERPASAPVTPAPAPAPQPRVPFDGEWYV